MRRRFLKLITVTVLGAIGGGPLIWLAWTSLLGRRAMIEGTLKVGETSLQTTRASLSVFRWERFSATPPSWLLRPLSEPWCLRCPRATTFRDTEVEPPRCSILLASPSGSYHRSH